MLERLKSIDYMYWASLVFMVFPIFYVVIGEIPSWHLLIDILFLVAYLGVFNHQEPAPILALLGRS